MIVKRVRINCCNLFNFSAEDDEGSKSSTNLPLIIGISCGAVVILAVLAICVVFHFKRSSSPHSISRVGDEMLTDEAPPIREKYELKPTTSKEENIIWMEEKGLSNKGME